MILGGRKSNKYGLENNKKVSGLLYYSIELPDIFYLYIGK